MGEFQEIVERTLTIFEETVNESGGIPEREIETIVEDAIGQGVGKSVNCYPGTPSNTCYEMAFFVSLQGSIYESVYLIAFLFDVEVN